jgi:hypothetical protein
MRKGMGGFRMTGVFGLRSIGLGVASWALPFLAAFAFYDSTGALAAPQPLFKSAMVVIGALFGTGLLVLAFRWGKPSFASGLALGLLWLAINLALDIAVLLPMSGMAMGDYLVDIGLRYLTLPIVAAGMGAVGARGP